MAILSEIRKRRFMVKTALGYVTYCFYTLASIVKMSDGRNVEDCITELNQNSIKEVVKGSNYIVIKHNNGLIEAHSKLLIPSNTAIKTAWGGIKRTSNAYTFPKLPVTFKEIYEISTTYSGSGGRMADFWISSSPSSGAIEGYLIHGEGDTTTASTYVYLTMIGY